MEGGGRSTRGSPRSGDRVSRASSRCRAPTVRDDYRRPRFAPVAPLPRYLLDDRSRHCASHSVVVRSVGVVDDRRWRLVVIRRPLARAPWLMALTTSPGSVRRGAFMWTPTEADCPENVLATPSSRATDGCTTEHLIRKASRSALTACGDVTTQSRHSTRPTHFRCSARRRAGGSAPDNTRISERGV